ncbi:MAG: alpha-amylase [Saprospiraceae bacterium]|nr:alpha-amylase [Saprospiraceae bacterium]
MYQAQMHRLLTEKFKENSYYHLDGLDGAFLFRFSANISTIYELYHQIYGHRSDSDVVFSSLLDIIFQAYKSRSEVLKKLDHHKSLDGPWYLSNQIAGMSLYIDRFCGTIKDLESHLSYFEELGINFLHLMPVMQSPEGESDGGYAVSDFRNVDPRFGTIDDLRSLDDKLKSKGMYLMLDIVLNHTSHHHEWAQKASSGDKHYQDFFYMYDDRHMPDIMERTMPDIFPDSSPGSFTYDKASGKWVMTVFNDYQWDLNYTNPVVFAEMLDNIFFYANLGVDILRIDAPAFIWKEVGTTCQNLPQAHTLLQLIKHCVQVATPGMALLGEAIVAPKEIMKYFGTGRYKGRECDVAYNATHMALQWDALATGDVRVMLAAQNDILQKPYGATWITYTRCHDDIGLGYEDIMIQLAGFNPYEHRTFLKNYYSGNFRGSTSKGALFGVNPKTNDARISGTLASLCGLEYGILQKLNHVTEEAINKILLMQAHSILLGGIPMLFYGDECAYTNDYSFMNDSGKNYDNRWMHRPVIDWKKNEKRKRKGTNEYQVFAGTKLLINIRKSHAVFGDYGNINWMSLHNIHIAGYVRYDQHQSIFCIFNFSDSDAYLTWFALREQGCIHGQLLLDLWTGNEYEVGLDNEYIVLKPYHFVILQQNK